MNKNTDNYKIHDFRHGQTELIDWSIGDYVISDYGRGYPEIALIMADGRVWGIKDEEIPADVWDFIDSNLIHYDAVIDADEDAALFADYVNSLPVDSGVW